MKKFLATVALLALVLPAQADCCYHRYGHYHGYGWVAPMVLGAAIGYELQPRQEVIVTPPLQTLPAPGAPTLWYCPKDTEKEQKEKGETRRKAKRIKE